MNVNILSSGAGVSCFGRMYLLMFRLIERPESQNRTPGWMNSLFYRDKTSELDPRFLRMLYCLLLNNPEDIDFV